MNEVPSVRIGSFCKTSSGTTPSRSEEARYYGGSIPWVKSGELREGEIYDTEEKVTDAALMETSLKLVPANALLLAMYGANVGRVGLLKIPATTNQAVCSIVPDPAHADVRYMFHALQWMAPAFVNRGVGGAQPNISQGIVQEAVVALPPLDEQRRIAAILDQADTIRQLNHRAIRMLGKLKFSLFDKMFGDPSQNPMGWPMRMIGEISESTQYGTSKPATGGPYPFLRMNNITADGELDLSVLKYIDLPPKELDKCLARDGDILFNRTNSPELVGKTTVFRGSGAFAIAGYIIRLRLNEAADAEYVSAYLNSRVGKAVLRSMCKAIIGMANINAQELKSISLPVPPVVLQRKFAEKIRQIQLEKAQLLNRQSILDAMFLSLQDQYFGAATSASRDRYSSKLTKTAAA